MDMDIGSFSSQPGNSQYLKRKKEVQLYSKSENYGNNNEKRDMELNIKYTFN